ncbi:unnamed protein product [Chrysoparadoxa australica]
MTGLSDSLKAEPELQDLSVIYLTTRSFDDEIANSVDGEIFLVVLMFMLMGIFVAATLGPAFDPVKGRKLLAGSGLLTIAVAIAAAYGLMSGMGVPFTPLTQILPFILVGIGVDDMFIIVQAFDTTDETLSTDERCVIALGRCGISIAFTSLTDFFGFMLGSLSSFPAVKYFCYYASAAVLFDFFFQVTVFVVLLAWDSDRIKMGHYDIAFWISSKSSKAVKEAGAATYATSQGNVNAHYEAGTPFEEMKEDMSEHRAEKVELQAEKVHVSGSSRNASWLSRWMEHSYTPFLMRPLTKAAVMAVSAAVLGVMVWGLFRVDEGLELTDLARPDSYASEFINVARAQGLFTWENLDPLGIYFDELDYSSTAVQAEILRLEVAAEEQRHVSGPRSSWIDAFVWYQAGISGAPGEEEPAFEDQLKAFLDIPEFQRFQDDVVLHEDGRIKMSRVQMYHVLTVTNDQKISAMLDLRDLLDGSSLEPTPFAYASATYIWNEQYIVLWQELLVNFGLVLGLVAALSLVILGRVRYTLLTVLVVAAVDVCVTGSVFYWGLDINGITGIALIMAVGLVVDYNVHLVHYYLNQSAGLTNQERLAATIGEVGPAISLGVSDNWSTPHPYLSCSKHLT